MTYVSAPRDFSTFFLDTANGDESGADGSQKKKEQSDSDAEMEERPRERRHRRRAHSRSSSEEPIDGLAAVNQVMPAEKWEAEMGVG